MNNFKAIRKELGFNQQQFASELEISQPHISGIENGRDNPFTSLLKILCAKFTISEDWLVDGIGSPLPSWDITTDEGALSKYNVQRDIFEKELRSSTGESLVSYGRILLLFDWNIRCKKVRLARRDRIS